MTQNTGIYYQKYQANGKGAMSGTDSTTPLASVSLTLYLKPKTIYNKSKKRTKIEGSNDEDKGTIALVAKKVNLRYTILGLLAEMARGRKAREEYKSAQEKAI